MRTQKQAISHTWNPGAKKPIEYPFGMPKPEPKCMAKVMKEAVQNTLEAK